LTTLKNEKVSMKRAMKTNKKASENGLLFLSEKLQPYEYHLSGDV
jgi:hypothetical protein